MSIIYKLCPKCGSHQVIDIVYGRSSEELRKEQQDGKILIGGDACMQLSPEGKLENLPIYYCKFCGHKWGRTESLETAYQKINRILLSCVNKQTKIIVSINLKTKEVAYEQIRNHKILKKDVKKVSSEAVGKYLSMIEFVDLLYWNRKYKAETAADNHHWMISIVKDKSRVMKKGINSYPSNWSAFWEVTCELLSTSLEF
jgi:hypothetical protein